MKSILILLCSVLTGISATNYVTKTGNDSNPGTLVSPWLTLGKATVSSSSGDTVIVMDGEYNECVTNPPSGTPSNPTTFVAQSTNTIIDPSVAFTNGWVAAPEVGFTVWKQTNMDFAARYMTIGGLVVASVYTNGDLSPANVNNVFTNGFASGLTTGTNCLLVSSGATYMRGGVECSFWDPLGSALYCTDTNTCYLRMRDGSDPNGLNIRMAPNYNGAMIDQPQFAAAAVRFGGGLSNITFRGFQVRGAFTGFFLHAAHHITLESNLVVGPFQQVYLETGSSNNVIRGNTLVGNFIGDAASSGAWEGVSANLEVKHGNYVWGKYMMGQSDTFSQHIYLKFAGSSNSIIGNTISGGISGDGVVIWGDVASPMFGTKIISNSIAKMTSTGILAISGQTFTETYGNYFSDCNSQFRIHLYNAVGEVNRTNFTYRNRFWNPTLYGDHIFVFADSPGGSYHPTDWVYHNSFSGGRFGLNFNGNLPAAGNAPNFRMINNIVSGVYYNNQPSAMNVPGAVGAYDYNWLGSNPLAVSAAWFGSHNIKSINNQWPNVEGMNFALVVGSQAIGAALDTSSSFTLGAVTYPALPDTTTQQGGSWDMGALEFQTFGGRVMRVTNLHINSAHVP